MFKYWWGMAGTKILVWNHGGTKSRPQEIHPYHTQPALSGLGSASQWVTQTCSGAAEKASQGRCPTWFPRPSACGHKSTELGRPFEIALCHFALQSHSFLCGPFSIEGKKILLMNHVMFTLQKMLLFLTIAMLWRWSQMLKLQGEEVLQGRKGRRKEGDLLAKAVESTLAEPQSCGGATHSLLATP